MKDENQNRIVNAYQERKEEQYFTKLVSNDEVLANGANLSVSSYVEKEDKREVIDIVALNEEIEALSKDVRNRSVELDEMIKEL
jgi:type I restriction enzyme M protein